MQCVAQNTLVAMMRCHNSMCGAKEKITIYEVIVALLGGRAILAKSQLHPKGRMEPPGSAFSQNFVKRKMSAFNLASTYLKYFSFITHFQHLFFTSASSSSRKIS